MAASTLPRLGTDLGPCLEPCAHRDCACTRRMATAGCALCGLPIGYEMPLYQVDDRDANGDRKLVHADCYEQESD